MKSALVGSGGREHALAWKLAQSPALDELHAAPGQPGHRAARRSAIRSGQRTATACSRSRERSASTSSWSGRRRRSSPGVADQLRRGGVAVFGPSAAAARIEGSKSFAKDVMRGGRRADRASAAGRAAAVRRQGGRARRRQGRLRLPRPQEELDAGAARRPRRSASRLVIEELLEGEELSVFALADGAHASPLAAPRRTTSASATATPGPNTGGMGSYSPVPGLGAGEVDELVETDPPAGARGARRARHAVRRRALRRADADRRRAAGARVQLPLRRPRDAGDPAAARRRPARARSRAAARATSRGVELAVVRRRRGDRRRSRPATIPSAATTRLADRRDRGGRGARRARLPRRHGAATASSS